MAVILPSLASFQLLTPFLCGIEMGRSKCMAIRAIKVVLKVRFADSNEGSNPSGNDVKDQSYSKGFYD
jgi:hypothetical protein